MVEHVGGWPPGLAFPGDTATRVLLAVVNQRRPTVRSVAEDAGVSVRWTHHQLRRLRTAGLVTWGDGQQGTLRATVRPVAFGVGSAP